MDKVGFYIKTILLTVLLFIESLFLADIIVKYVETQNYFGLSSDVTIKSIGIMILLLITFSLTVGAWNGWLQYIIIPLPISAAVMLSILRFNVMHAITAGSIAALILLYNIFVSTRVRNLLIRFEPRMILRFSTKSILFVFSLFAGLVVILHTTSPMHQLNIGKMIANTVKEPVKKIVQNQLRDSLMEQSFFMNEQSSIDLSNLDPQTVAMLEQMGYGDVLKQIQDTNGKFDPNSLVSGIDVENIIQTQINTVVEPYKNFLRPILGLLVFGLYEFYAFFASIIFYLLVDIIFWLAKQTGFFKVDIVPAQKEILKF